MKINDLATVGSNDATESRFIQLGHTDKRTIPHDGEKPTAVARIAESRHGTVGVVGDIGGFGPRHRVGAFDDEQRVGRAVFDSPPPT